MTRSEIVQLLDSTIINRCNTVGMMNPRISIEPIASYGHELTVTVVVYDRDNQARQLAATQMLDEGILIETADPTEYLRHSAESLVYQLSREMEAHNCTPVRRMEARSDNYFGVNRQAASRFDYPIDINDAYGSPSVEEMFIAPAAGHYSVGVASSVHLEEGDTIDVRRDGISLKPSDWSEEPKAAKKPAEETELYFQLEFPER